MGRRLSARMVAGLDSFMGEHDRAVAERQKLWQRDFSSRAAYEKSVQQNRERFRKYVGAVDPRLPVNALDYVTSTAALPLVAETDRFRVYAVRWPVFRTFTAKDVATRPKAVRARVWPCPTRSKSRRCWSASHQAAGSRSSHDAGEETRIAGIVQVLAMQEPGRATRKLKRFTNSRPANGSTGRP